MLHILSVAEINDGEILIHTPNGREDGKVILKQSKCQDKPSLDYIN